MRLRFLIAAAITSQALIWPVLARAEDGEKELQGVWAAKSMEVNGKPAPPEAVERMRFTFKEDKLLIKGNFKNDREDECVYSVEPSTKPKQFNFTPNGSTKPILGIYDIKGDELKICMRHLSSSEGRPTEFATKPDSHLILTVFKKEKP